MAAAGAMPYETVIIRPPLQSFTLDDLVFFIVPKEDTAEALNRTGKWLVPYVVENVPDPGAAPPPPPPAPGGAAAAVPAGPPPAMMDLARPEDAAAKLPVADRDDWADVQRINIDPMPNPEYAQLHRHYIEADRGTQRQVGALFLKPLLERAERLDYEFALRMQGLQNTTINAVWVCKENGGAQPEDRAEMMEQFLKTYLSRFLSRVPQTSNEEPDDVIREAVQMHQQFCSGWVREHKRSLSPVIESTAEALVGLFWEGALKPAIRPGMTWKQMSRVILRDPRLSPQFGVCLHFYMVKLEQDRGSRNASYKSMFNASSSNMLAINSMDAFLRKEAGYIASITAGLATAEQRRFDVRCMDWYSIVSQLPLPKMEWSGLKKSRLSTPGPVTPWARQLLLRTGDGT